MFFPSIPAINLSNSTLITANSIKFHTYLYCLENEKE